ncbi:hypothetical protein RFF05_01135 [Bengtsoniella intestinalis]|uniref:4'-phosphopantetheinyl transferase family protein n=1 Tax=Bengtsoniella intestinalis TaxID=3073143 RepID=UPI00391F763C
MEIQYNIVTWEPQTPWPIMAQLPQSWQAHLQHHKQEDKRKQAAFGYELLFKMVVKWLGVAPELAVTPAGKPYFLTGDVHFSISHTQGAAMVALAQEPVGVDIEKIRPISAHMMERVAKAQNQEVFFKTWVSREAMGKCLGTGITITGQVDGAGIVATCVRAPQGYMAAIAQKNRSGVS